MAAVVQIDNLVKRYPKVDALNGVSLEIEEGEIFALLGPNGAGKTTMIGCIAGLVQPTSGRALVGGFDVVREFKKTRRQVGLVPQEINFDPFFTAAESLRFQAGYFGIKLSEEKLDEILRALGLFEKKDAWARSLSGGMKRRLLIGKALVHDPKVLFLDEPTAGVDVELRRDLWAYVRKLRAQGTTIVLTTHYLEEAEELADRVGLIDKGRLLLVEKKETLMARLGQRTIRITLGSPAEKSPVAEGQLLAGGTVLEVKQPVAAELGPLLTRVVEAGLAIRDVETKRTGLEEIYVKLLREQRTAA